jgi:hypothetical protein
LSGGENGTSIQDIRQHAAQVMDKLAIALGIKKAEPEKAKVIIDESHNLNACLKEFVYGCGTDSECVGLASDHCSQYLPQGCSFGAFGVECNPVPSHCSVKVNEHFSTVECPEFDANANAQQSSTMTTFDWSKVFKGWEDGCNVGEISDFIRVEQGNQKIADMQNPDHYALYKDALGKQVKKLSEPDESGNQWSSVSYAVKAGDYYGLPIDSIDYDYIENRAIVKSGVQST